MKKRHIDEFWCEHYSCDKCGESIDEYSKHCDICGNDLSTTDRFPLFKNREQGESYYENKYIIMTIQHTSDPDVGIKYLLVKANPVNLQHGGISFTPHMRDDETVGFFYLDTQENLAYLTNIAQNSLLEIDVNEFILFNHMPKIYMKKTIE